MSALDDCSAALNAMKAAERDVKQVIERMKHCVEVLREWDFVNFGKAGRFASGKMDARPETLTSADWPEIETVTALVAKYHEARKRARKAYEAVPEADRDNFKEPPGDR